MKLTLVTWILTSQFFAAGAYAQGLSKTMDNIEKPSSMASTEKPRDFEGMGIFEKLGDKLDLSLPLVDELGQSVRLGQFFDGKLPVSLSLVYFSCPGLCNFHLNGLVETLKGVDWSAGDKFQVLAISFDPKENFELAAKKKASYMKIYNREGTEAGFHFLTASPEVIAKIAEQIGFKYKWNEEAKEWAHASAAVIVTPDGTISRYHHGIQFDSPTLKMSFNEAADGKIGNFVDKMVWYCFKYDPHQSKYVIYAFRAVQIGGILIMIILALILLPVWFRGRLFR